MYDEMKTCACEPERIENLTSTMQKTAAIASDVLRLSERLNAHLFGIDCKQRGEELEPKCFADELNKTCGTLLATAEELSKLCSLLGL